MSRYAPLRIDHQGYYYAYRCAALMTTALGRPASETAEPDIPASVAGAHMIDITVS